jgi:hypothetical protein
MPLVSRMGISQACEAEADPSESHGPDEVANRARIVDSRRRVGVIG